MTTAHASHDFPAALLGPVIWAVHFLLVYALEALLCLTPGPSTGTIVRSIGLLITCAALALLVLALWSRRHSRLDHAADGHQPVGGAFITPLTLLSILAILWTSLPLITLPACTTM